jgi:hypothetical protein
MHRLEPPGLRPTIQACLCSSTQGDLVQAIHLNKGANLGSTSTRNSRHLQHTSKQRSSTTSRKPPKARLSPPSCPSALEIAVQSNDIESTHTTHYRRWDDRSSSPRLHMPKDYPIQISTSNKAQLVDTDDARPAYPANPPDNPSVSCKLIPIKV